jgi:hypothetical protein
MKLFTELNEDVQLITETNEKDGKKLQFIEGIFLQAEIKNRNGRIYPIHVMENAVNKYLKEKVKGGNAFGELGHPSGPTINLDRVSHIITELRKDGNNYIGKAKIANTPMGEIARGIMESGGRLGVSSRAMGSLREQNGSMVVQDDLKISTAADIVADPSAPDAFVNGLMENVEWIFDPIKNTWMEQKAESLKGQIHGLSKNEREAKQMAIFEDYINSLISL